MGEDCIRCALLARSGRVGELERRVARHDVFIAGAREGRIVGPDRDGQHRGRGEPVQRSKIVLPAAPDRRVSARPQEGILQHGGIRQRRGIVGAGRRVVERLIGLAAAIGRLVHHLMIALAEVDRLEDVEVVGVLDVAVLIPRGQRDVRDDRILRVRRIYLALCDPDDELVLTDERERMAAEGGAALEDGDLGDARVRHWCRRKHRRRQKTRNAKPQYASC